MGVGFQAVIWIVAVMFTSVAMMYFILIGAVDTIIDYRKTIEKRKLKKDGGNEK
jgi:Flp pilus assembly protein TadB